MEKRIPQNPKYKNLQSKIDTGATVNKVRLICTSHTCNYLVAHPVWSSSN